MKIDSDQQLQDFIKFKHLKDKSNDIKYIKRLWYRANDLSRISESTREKVKNDPDFSKIPNYILIDKHKTVYYTIDEDGRRHYTELGCKMQAQKSKELNKIRHQKSLANIPFGFCYEEDFPDSIMDFIEYYHIKPPYDYLKVKKYYIEVNRVRNDNIRNHKDFGKKPVWKIKAELGGKRPINQEFLALWKDYCNKTGCNLKFHDAERLDQNKTMADFVKNDPDFGKIPNFQIKIKFIAKEMGDEFDEAKNAFSQYKHWIKKKIGNTNFGANYKICPICNKETLHFKSMCTRCHALYNIKNVIKNCNFERKDNVLYYKGKLWTLWCNEWNLYLNTNGSEGSNPYIHSGINKRFGVWCIGTINPLDNAKLLKDENFKFVDNVLYYKGKLWNDWCYMWDLYESTNGQQGLNPSLYPQINKRCNIWCYGALNPESNKNIFKSGHFACVDDVLFYKGIEWNKYKEIIRNNIPLKINTNTNNKNGNNTNNINSNNGFIFDINEIKSSRLYSDDLFKLPFDQNFGFIVPTFRVQDSNHFENKIAFEKYICELGITWFQYTKFYIDSYGVSKPLISGITGSMLVNLSGTDIIFDYTDEINGQIRAGRKFLKENNLDWNKTFITLIPCTNKNDAQEKEIIITDKFNLFGS